jgi:hypothetical protein
LSQGYLFPQLPSTSPTSDVWKDIQRIGDLWKDIEIAGGIWKDIEVYSGYSG